MKWLEIAFVLERVLMSLMRVAKSARFAFSHYFTICCKNYGRIISEQFKTNIRRGSNLQKYS